MNFEDYINTEIQKITRNIEDQKNNLLEIFDQAKTDTSNLKSKDLKRLKNKFFITYDKTKGSLKFTQQ